MDSLSVPQLLAVSIVGYIVFALFKTFGASSSSSASSSPASASAAGDSIDAVVGPASLLEDESACEVEVEGTRILVAKSHGEYFAVSAKCPHYGAPLIKGVVSDGRIKCPWHGACFHLGTGDIEDFPCSDGLQTFGTRVENGEVIVTATREELAVRKRVPTMAPASRRNKQVVAIIGAGTAGQAAAEGLRHFGYTGGIIMIGNEPDRPYDRTKVSKAMSATGEKLALRPESFYTENSIELMLGHEVSSFDPATKTLELATGREITCDNVIIATGGNPRRLPIENFDAPNVFQLRVPYHSNSIYAEARDARVVIVGSSFIGMEAAAAVINIAKSVHVIGMEKEPFERVLGPQVGAAFRALHEKKGVSFHMECIVKEFIVDEEAGPVKEVVLNNGVRLEADLLVIGAGVVPATQFVKETAGIKKERDGSIIVDERMQSKAPGVYVVGDIARFPYHAVGGDTIRVEHFGTAQQQGHIAASNIAKGTDGGLVYDTVPFFWTQVFGKSIRYAGHAFMFTDVHMVGDVNGFNFMAVYGKNGRVDAVVTAGRDPQASAACEVLRRGLMPTFDEVVALGDALDFVAMIKANA